MRRVLEQALVFAGAAFAAVYAPGADGELLCLVESVGVPRTLCGVRDSYPVAGRSPAAEAHRGGRPVWLGPRDLAAQAQSRRVPSRDFFLAALPLRGDGGCLLAVSDHPGGFDADDRACLDLVADGIAFPAAPAAPDGGDLPPGSFSLAMDTGRLRVGEDILDLFGLDPDDFDGRVETLMGLTVPEDLPSLMSVVEADHMTIGERELEFRVLQPAGPPKWLRLRGRLVPGGEGRPARLVGSITDASTLRSDITDVARVQRLAAALATAVTVHDVGKAVVAALRRPLRADRIAMAKVKTAGSSSPSSTRRNRRRGRRGVAHRVARRARAHHAHPRRRAARGPHRHLARGVPAGDRPRRGRPGRSGRAAAARREPHGRRLPHRLGHPARLRRRRTRPAHRRRRARRTGTDAGPRLRRRARAGRHAPAPSCCRAACPGCRAQ
ncbi:hypothetical protein SGRIM128S_06384 [Streptomyces griseomycini]